MLNRCDDRDIKSLVRQFKKLSSINWSLNEAPFAHLLSILDEETGSWKMANEERTQRCAVALDIVLWLVGVTEPTDDEVKEMKVRWNSFALRTSQTADEIWEKVKSQKSTL